MKMPRHHMKSVLFVAASISGWSCAGADGPPGNPGERTTEESHMKIEIPESMRVEHDEIHGALVAATGKPGRVEAAAKELATLLHPHFVREEEVALPPLGLLEPLARGDFSPGMVAVLPMTDALRAELPAMLEQHRAIGAAARRLEAIAGEEGDGEVAALARKLQLHARGEEEIFYPAAILVGDIVRARR